MNVIFAGTPVFAARALSAIIDAGFNVPLVLTQPDRPSGRGMKLTPSPVKQVALQHNIPVAQPISLRLNGKHPEQANEARAQMVAAKADVMVVAPCTANVLAMGAAGLSGTLLGAALLSAGGTGGAAPGAALLAAYSLGVGLPFLAASLAYRAWPAAQHRLQPVAQGLRLAAGVGLALCGAALALGAAQRLISPAARLLPA